MTGPVSHITHPQQLHVMKPRSATIAGADAGLLETHSTNLVVPSVRFAEASQISPSFSRLNTSDTRYHKELLSSTDTSTNQSNIMAHSATLLLLLFLLPLIALFIYNLFRKLWNKFIGPRFPSNQQDTLSQCKEQNRQQKKKPMRSALVVVLANALARPDVQLLNRVRRQFVDDEYASNCNDAQVRGPKTESIVAQDRATIETSLVTNQALIPESQNEDSEVEKKKKAGSVISIKQEELQLQKQVEPSSKACQFCGGISEELEERCHSHSPRASNLRSPSKSELASGCSVSPIMLNCQQELGCGCRLAAKERHAKLASRRLSRQPTDSVKHRCLKLFYEHYYDEEAQENEKHKEYAYRRLELELANSRGLQESAQELMELAESDQSLYSSKPSNAPYTIKDVSTISKADKQLAQPLVAGCTHLQPNGSDCELASSTSTSLGGSDSGFGACRIGALCAACQAAALYPSCTTPSSTLAGLTHESNPPEIVRNKPVVRKSSSAGKWRLSQRQQVALIDSVDMQLPSGRASRRMSVAGDQVCNNSVMKSAYKFQNRSPRILPRYTRRPSDTYLYGDEASADVEDGYNKSTYSSSGGSSSGIGVSGSACTNTPTARAFPYSSFVDSDSAGCNLMSGHPLHPATLYHNTNAVVANLLTHQQEQLALDSSPASRKYSLPVQLEWRANERLSPKCARLLFDRNLQPHQPTTFHQQLTDDFGGVSVASSLRPEEARRSSQTITRQSSFWLTDQSDDSVLSLANTFEPASPANIEEPVRHQQMLNSASVDQQPPEPVTRSARASLSSIAVLSGDSIESVKRRPLAITSDQCSTPMQHTEATEKESQAGGDRRLSARNSSSTATSNSTGDSPSPPESSRPGNRMLSNRSSCWLKRPKLKTKRHQRSEDIATKRRRAFKMRTGVQQHSAPSASNTAKDEEWHEDDDDNLDGAGVAMMHADCPLGPMQSTCSLPQHIRKAATTSYEGTSTFKTTTRTSRTDKKDSANLERQCRELWKLRATLHDDSCFSDNWANYHQRLNRRYDSGYKSIEHQFSSSFEAPIRASAATQAGSASLDFPRPPSSCSNLQPIATTNQLENKMAHLELAEDQKDTPTSSSDDRESHSRSSKCSSNEDENNNKM